MINLRGTLFLLILLFSLCAHAQIEIMDSHGKYRFSEPPTRIVVLNWALTEQLLELEVSPLGVADLAQFKDLSTRYTLPDSVHDLGARLAPDLSKIRALKPDIILIGYSQRSLLKPLSNIATVIYFNNFSKRYDNAEKSDERFLELAKLFDKSEFADAKLRNRDQRLDELKRMVGERHSSSESSSMAFLVPPPVSGGRYSVFGVNSIPYSAASRLGLKPISPEKTDKYGVGQLDEKSLIELFDKRNGEDQRLCIVVFDRLNSQTALPKKRNHFLPDCIIHMSYQMPFGGAMSILWLAEDLTEFLTR